LLTGIRLQALPTDLQRLTLSRWIGCDRVVWNAKCDEHRYMAAYARKFCPLGTYAPIDQTYSQFKDSDLTPWLSEVPSQILRNSAVNWYKAYQRFFKKLGGRPRRKKRTDRGSVHLTRELFRFEKNESGELKLFIGTKTNDLGCLEFTAHREFGIPNSIRIVREAGKWFVSFSYEDGKAKPEPAMPQFSDPQDRLEWLRAQGREWLEGHVRGNDRGIVVPVQSGDDAYDFTPEQKTSLWKTQKKDKRLQKRLTRQDKGSKRRARTKLRLARVRLKERNVRKDFCHKASRKIVDGAAPINVFENLKLKNMVRRPKAVRDENGKFLPNGARAKAGLNRGLLSNGLGMVVDYAQYKAEREGKIVLLIDPRNTSRECASCGHVDSDSRRTQAKFECTACGHRDNADRNASIIIGKRAVDLIMDSGTELSERGILSKPKREDTGRGAEGKTEGAEVSSAHGEEASKREALQGFLREAA